MPNYCDFNMRVKGSKENVKEFVRIIQADYDEVPKHFWRVFEAGVVDETEAYTDLCGYCAWSVCSCMRDGFGTYNTDSKTGERAENGTTLDEQSKLLNLEIEVYSTEPGMGFAEHYLFNNGDCLIDECIDYAEMYFEDEEDFEQAKEEWDYQNVSWEDVNEDGYYITGGYGEWSYQI